VRYRETSDKRGWQLARDRQLRIAELALERPPSSLDILTAMPSPPTRRDHLPERSADQRSEALSQANRVRQRRAALKAELKQGDASIVALITDPPQYLATAKIAELLMALPGYGPLKVGRLQERCQMSAHKTVAGLNERQRAELVEALEA